MAEVVVHESEARSEKAVSICPAGLGQLPSEATQPRRSLTALEPCWRGSQMEPVLPAIPVRVLDKQMKMISWILQAQLF